MEIKIPTTKAEMEALRQSLIQEIEDDELDAVAGGNDDVKGKSTEIFVCPYCGAHVQCKQKQDAAKHMVQACPNNPFG